MDMNLDVLYTIIFILIALAGSFGFAVMRKSSKIKVSLEDMIFVSSMFDLSVEVMKELGLFEEKLPKTIAEVVALTLEFAEKNLAEAPDLHRACEDFAFGLCDQFGLVLTESRQDLMSKLIMIGLDSLEEVFKKTPDTLQEVKPTVFMGTQAF